MSKIVEKYNLISSDEYKKGAIYALINAYELFGDGMIMYGLKRYPRAFSLIKLSFEEAAKALLFFDISLLKDWSKYDNRFESMILPLIKSIELHNDKTVYGLDFLIKRKKEFIEFHPNPNFVKEESFLSKELKELEKLLINHKLLDNKKNTNLYTSLIENEFKLPLLSVNVEDVENIIQLSFKVLGFMKNEILSIDEIHFKTIQVIKDEIRKLDPFVELRKINDLQSAYKMIVSNMETNNT